MSEKNKTENQRILYKDNILVKTKYEDNVDIIKTNSYKYFKTVLKNKLIELEKSYDKKNEDIENSNFNLRLC